MAIGDDIGAGVAEIAEKTEIWRDRFIKREMLPAGELTKRFNVGNPRTHPDEQKEATESSLDQIGWMDDISLSTNGDGPASLVDNPDAVMFDGHERAEIALVRFGPDALVPVRWYQLTPEETDFALLVKDQTTAMAGVDAERMGALMERAKAMTAAPGLQGMLARLKEQVAEGLLDIDFLPFNGNGDGGGSQMAQGTKVRIVLGPHIFDIDDSTHSIYNTLRLVEQDDLQKKVTEMIKSL